MFFAIIFSAAAAADADAFATITPFAMPPCRWLSPRLPTPPLIFHYASRHAAAPLFTPIISLIFDAAFSYDAAIAASFRLFAFDSATMPPFRRADYFAADARHAASFAAASFAITRCRLPCRQS
jgi:hypothetical protein